MRDVELFGKLCEVKRVLIIDLREHILALFLARTQSANEGVYACQLLFAVLERVKVVLSDECKLASVLFRLPLFQLSSNDQDKFTNARTPFCKECDFFPDSTGGSNDGKAEFAL